MDTRDRISLIIKNEGLTQVAFAGATGINTSTLNHVLTGRNNPSAEVISKILTAFPMYESDWLLHGTGSMWTEEYRELQAQRSTVPLFDTNTVISDDQGRRVIGMSSTIEANDQVGRHPTTGDPEMSSRPERHSVMRRVEKVIIYYDDQTFETLYPASEAKSER